MLFSYGSGQQRINDNEKCRQIARDFDCHADAAVRRGAHRPMEHIRVYTWSHWMITSSAAMVKEFKSNTQNTNKTQPLASYYGTSRSLVVCENCIPNMDPLLSSLMRWALCKYEMPQLELESSAKFLDIKHCQRTTIGKVIKLARSSIKKWVHIFDDRG